MSRLLPHALLLAALVIAEAARGALPELGEGGPRQAIELADGWRTVRGDAGAPDPADFSQNTFDDRAWTPVSVPHNWDVYAGLRQAKHGNLHGSAWYRVRFSLPQAPRPDQRVFLFFEGVGSYATVWLNGQRLGSHAGGLTTFTLDATEAVRAGNDNVLAVRADHPAGIRDLPWVCGGCEHAYGFSEGSEPFGIFRPVHVLVTNAARIAPFGVHVWNDREIGIERAAAHVEVEVENHGAATREIQVRTRLLDDRQRVVAESTASARLDPAARTLVRPADLTAAPARLWSLEDPRLYTLRTEILEAATGTLLDRVDTPYGFRWIEWPRPDGSGRGTFLLNGRPTFLNGTCEYPHVLGGSHAFTAGQIRARVRQIEAAGFNAFRDAHHPHNLRYQEFWDADGLAWWPQFGAHVWFDRDDFRANYLALLADWVKERRNSPSLVLWGLQNESQLPADFAREAVALIRQLDPTAGPQRLVTTCNGGSGTDWDVPQNWTGTYGGDPATYADDLRKQRLVGEYGAWRSIDLHADAPDAAAGFTEEDFNGLLETKLVLGRSVAADVAGHFQWPFATHENPGRTFGAKGEQLGEGWGRLDRLGPANNKGLLTLWGEPLDAYYLYRSHEVPAATQPMVVLAGATNPDRWTAPGRVDGIVAYSNCDEVELFNDAAGGASLGVRRRNERGHFRWDGVELRWNLLRAVAYRDGQPVAEDSILLHHLPRAPQAEDARSKEPDTTAPAAGWRYLYRVNCGGPSLVDSHGARWLADREWRDGSAFGAESWADAYPDLDPAQGSVRRIGSPVAGTRDPALYQTFRYGRKKLRYRFSLPNGHYRVELHFAEPWYGRGATHADGWRLFDVALNGTTVTRDVDLWKEAGYARALCKDFETEVRDGQLVVSFPRVASYEAVIAGIAIARREDAGVANLPEVNDADLVRDLHCAAEAGVHVERWLNTGDRLHLNEDATIAQLPEELRQASWLRLRAGSKGNFSFAPAREMDAVAAVDDAAPPAPGGWEYFEQPLVVVQDGKGRRLTLWRRHLAAGQTLAFAHAPEFVVLLPTRPFAPAQAVRNVKVSGSETPGHWRSAGNLRAGLRLNGPNGAALNRLPQDLVGSDWFVSPARENGTDLRVAFEVTDHADVYVALDRRITAAPAWLREWEPVSGEVQVGSTLFALRRKHFSAGETVVLGANGQGDADATDGLAGYCVFVRPTRPAVVYDAANVILDARRCEFEWPIQVGVGDRYRFTIAHRVPTTGPSRLRYEFLDRAGTVLCSEGKDLSRAGAGEGWNVWRLRTCTSVNAGTYLVRLTWLSGAPVELRSLTVE